jgi:hypothetical protein
MRSLTVLFDRAAASAYTLELNRLGVGRRSRKKRARREIETVVVDVVEKPAPRVVTMTEFEETQVPSWGCGTET